MGTLKYDQPQVRADWGCSFTKVSREPSSENIFLCHVKISDIKKIASELSNAIMNRSWIMELDRGARRSYEKTVAETAQCLVDIFETEQKSKSNGISTEFGEIMVSMGSSKALEVIFSHNSLPIAELWKPQKKQNEGFDFHTLCPNKFINFGEAKYSGSDNPHGEASSQAHHFFEAEKHFRDRVHLINLVETAGITNLDAEAFGVVLAFSMNAKFPSNVFENAILTALAHESLKRLKSIYIVGVTHDCKNHQGE